VALTARPGEPLKRAVVPTTSVRASLAQRGTARPLGEDDRAAESAFCPGYVT